MDEALTFIRCTILCVSNCWILGNCNIRSYPLYNKILVDEYDEDDWREVR
uniref:Uncharacterized protein n=1 Tax=viral metagenome TaxID=1070528 RepID=A0A6H1ZI98_9ZZZZ